MDRGMVDDMVGDVAGGPGVHTDLGHVMDLSMDLMADQMSLRNQVGLDGLVNTGSGDSDSSRDNMVGHGNRGSMGNSSNRGSSIGQAVSSKDTMMSGEDTMMSVTQTNTSIIGISVGVSSWGSHGGADDGKKNNKEVHGAES